MKRTITISSLFALALMLTVSVAFANYRGGGDRHGDDGLEVDINNSAHVRNNVDSSANTGQNSADRNKRSGRVDTGNAHSESWSTTEANTNDIRIRARGLDDTEVSLRNNGGVYNNVNSRANTGYNSADGNGSYSWFHSRGHGSVETGNATSLADTLTLLNSNVVRLGR